MKLFKISLALLILSVSSGTKAFDASYNPPGDIYLMFGAFRMYIQCEGQGDIPVIIETGIGDTLANWLPVQDSLAKHTKVCVYDRAGNGLSDPGPGPRTASQISYELHALLEKAKVKGPYIIVGHSFGGYVAQFFARAYPDDTAGVVLVDSSHPDQIERLAELDKMPNKPKQNVGGYKFEDESLLTYDQKYWKHLNAQRKSVWTQMDELGSFKDSARELKRIKQALPPVPLAVLTRGISQLPDIPGVKSLETEWQEMQKELATLNNKGWQVIVENSGHSIHQEAPEAVIDNTLKVLEIASRK